VELARSWTTVTGPMRDAVGPRRPCDLGAIYNAGAGNPGIARALSERGRAGKVVLIGMRRPKATSVSCSRERWTLPSTRIRASRPGRRSTSFATPRVGSPTLWWRLASPSSSGKPAGRLITCFTPSQ
jgi:hypothetical protein